MPLTLRQTIKLVVTTTALFMFRGEAPVASSSAALEPRARRALRGTPAAAAVVAVVTASAANGADGDPFLATDARRLESAAARPAAASDAPIPATSAGAAPAANGAQYAERRDGQKNDVAIPRLFLEGAATS